jgi:DHA2 family methylenomycin A resistance protein-like MFS transporter
VPRYALVASSLAFSLVLLDTSLVNVALPAIRDDLDAGVDGLQWVVNAYTLVFASLLMSAGALADRIGARRLLLLGVGIFALGSLAAIAADSLGALIAAQAFLGVGAALLVPASLALLTHSYPESSGRARALGIWASVAAVAFAASPVVAGAIIDAAGWRGVFAVNVPFVLAVFVLVRWFVPPTPRGLPRGLDLPGQAAAMVALASLTLALIESGSLGWAAPGVLAAFLVAVVAGTAFVAIERRSPDPMLPLGLFDSRGFSVSVGAGVLLSFALYGELFLISLYLQEERGLSATEMGLTFLPQPVATALVGVPAGWMIGRIGPRTPLAVGGAVGAVAALLLVTVNSTTPYWLLIVAFVLWGSAAGAIVPAITTAAVSSVPVRQVGVASSALNTGRQAGAVLGIAVLGGLISETDFVSGLPVALCLCALAMLGVSFSATGMSSRQRALDSAAHASR